MDPQLKELNKLLKNNLKKLQNKTKPSSRPFSSGPRRIKKSRKRRNSELFLKTFIIIVLLIVVPISLILGARSLDLNKVLKREIVISGQGAKNKTIINLGFLGLIFPSRLKNKEQINLLFLGIAGEGHRAPDLTDTIVILNSTPKGENPIGISIPRDLWVQSPSENYYTKINAIYQKNGIEEVKTILKEVTNLNIDYFIVFDLEGVKKIIDLVGGIDVLVENDIYDPLFPGPNDSYTTFSLNKGIHHLDGETALKYIRTRYQPGGDFNRIKRQQQVIGILKDKILSLNLFRNFFTVLKIWKTLNKHIYTNIGLTDIKYAWNLAKKTNLEEITFATLSNQPGEEIQLLISDRIILGEEEAYILKPKTGLNNYDEIKNYINQLITTP